METVLSDFIDFIDFMDNESLVVFQLFENMLSSLFSSILGVLLSIIKIGSFLSEKEAETEF